MALKAKPPMSRTALSHDTAPMESIFHTRKVELAHQRRCTTREQAESKWPNTLATKAGEHHAMEVEVTGRLNAILCDVAYPNGVERVCGLMVAKEGLEPPTRGL